MRHGSLFSGIGGFDLAAQWMGWENVFHCEWNEFGKRVLSYYWPKAISYHDITKTDFTIHRGGIDILTGGFPCQPYSMAGKRKGKDDERHLWPEMLRAIREIQPRWVVGENVLGLVSWDGGLVFEEVQADLEAEGYEVQPYVLPACAVNAPHRRDRVWFVAHSCSARTGQSAGRSSQSRELFQEAGWEQDKQQYQPFGATCVTPNPDFLGRKERGQIGRWKDTAENTARLDNRVERFGNDWGAPNAGQYGNTVSDWGNFPQTQPTIRSGDDGFSSRLDGITFPKWRNESIKAAGNAIVPQVAYQIFRAIELYEIQNGAK